MLTRNKLSVPRAGSKYAVGRQLHLCLNLEVLGLPGLRYRRLCPQGDRLAGQHQAHGGLRSQCIWIGGSRQTCCKGQGIGLPPRSRIIIFIDILQPKAGGGRHRVLGQQPRGQLRKCLSLNDPRRVQGRDHSPALSIAKLRSRRIGHTGMGRLVQQSPPA